MKLRLRAFGIILLLSCAATMAQEKDAYPIVSAQSKIEIDVYREGVFKAFGHDHLIVTNQVSGNVQCDPEKIESSTVRLTVEAKSLTVADPGESDKDRQSVQATMIGDTVLDVAKFPEIVFSSTGVSAVKQVAGGWELTLSGELKLHGIEKQISLPLRIHVESGRIEARGETSLLQTDYGITPVKAGGGSVKVKDKLKFSFSIVAARTGQ